MKTIQKDTFGYRLNELIKSSFMTKSQFADKLGFTKAQVSQWCNNRHTPRHDNVLEIAKHFDTDPAWLLFGKTNNDLRQYEQYMKKLDRSDHEHLERICNDMLRDLANATIIVGSANKDQYPPQWNVEKVEKAVEKMALFVATFPFLYMYADYTAVVRFFIQKLNEHDDPTLEEKN
jgi:transcriptional regulator with XRE-family HTH domain